MTLGEKTQKFVLKVNSCLQEVFKQEIWQRRDKNIAKYYKGDLSVSFSYSEADLGMIGVTIDYRDECYRQQVEDLLKKHDINFNKRQGFGGLFPTAEFIITNDNLNMRKSFFIELGNIF